MIPTCDCLPNGEDAEVDEEDTDINDFDEEDNYLK